MTFYFFSYLLIGPITAWLLCRLSCLFLRVCDTLAQAGQSWTIVKFFSSAFGDAARSQTTLDFSLGGGFLDLTLFVDSYFFFFLACPVSFSHDPSCSLHGSHDPGRCHFFLGMHGTGVLNYVI